MKHSKLLLLYTVAIAAMLLPFKMKATHAGGGEIIYEFISDSTYRYLFKFYRDCTGGRSAPDSESPYFVYSVTA